MKRLIMSFIFLCLIVVSTPQSRSQASSAASGGTLKVQYRNADSTTLTNFLIIPWFQIINSSSTAVSLSTLKIRYWFTSDGGATTFTPSCTWATIGCANINLSIVTMGTPTSTADHYLEVSFPPTAGSIAANG